MWVEKVEHGQKEQAQRRAEERHNETRPLRFEPSCSAGANGANPGFASPPDNHGCHVGFVIPSPERFFDRVLRIGATIERLTWRDSPWNRKSGFMTGRPPTFRGVASMVSRILLEQLKRGAGCQNKNSVTWWFAPRLRDYEEWLLLAPVSQES